MPFDLSARRLLHSRRVMAAAGAVVVVLVAAAVWAGTGRSGHGDSAAPTRTTAPTSVAGVVPRDTSGARGGGGPGPTGTASTSVNSAVATTNAAAGGAGPAGATTTAPQFASLSLPSLGEGWVTLASLHSGGDERSAVFHLRQRDTRLRYRSDAASITISVVDAARGPDATAGFADAECSRTCDESYMAINDPPGDYYLTVRGDGGPWVVDVSERS